MNVDLKRLIALFVLFFWLMCAVFWVTGCSAKHHLNRYQAKGGVCGKIDTIKVMRFDTLTNEYRYFDSLVIVNDRVVPLTRQEIRYRYKIHYDTLKHKETIVKEITKQAKEQTKQVKAENKQPWAWVAIGVIFLILIYVIKSWKHR
jgi:hypothetical protein